MNSENTLTIKNLKLKDLRYSEYNPRKTTKEQEKHLRDSLTKFGVVEPIVVNSYPTRENIIVGGHFRVKELKKLGYKSVDCVMVNLNEDDEKELNIRLNSNTGDWDYELLNNNFDCEDLKDWGLEYDFDEYGGNNTSDKFNSHSRDNLVPLSKRYLIPPFSVIDTKQQSWQVRKKQWLNLGIRSELGRDSNLLFSKHLKKITKLPSTSVFDAVLCEVMYNWFSKEDDRILDPFAGGSVRGIVASILKRNYTGIDLSEKQIKENIRQVNDIIISNGNNSNDDIKNDYNSGKYIPNYLIGDSNKVLDTLDDNSYDMCLSCPPYFNLEKYSDSADDLSNKKNFNEFLVIYESIIDKLYHKLKDNTFVVWVIGEVRDKKDGSYYNLVGNTIDIFIKSGFKYYNELILLNSIVTAAIRANGQFKSTRKVVKVHQNILVFLKGNAKEATKRLGDVEVLDIVSNSYNDDE